MKNKSKAKEKLPAVAVPATNLPAKKVRFPIGIKLNAMVSFILILLLVGVSLLATYFFQSDSISRIQENVSDKSRVLSLKVQEDLRGIENQSKLIGLTFDLATTFLTQNKSAQPPSVYRRQLLEQNKTIFYVAAVRVLTDTSGNKTLRFVEDAENSKLISASFSATPNFQAAITKEPLIAERAILPNLLIANISSVFQAPVLMATMPFITANTSEVQVSLVVFFSMQAFLEGLETYTQYISYIVNEKGELVGHPDPNLLVNRISFAKNPMVHSALTSPMNNRQITYTDEDGLERIGSYYKIDTGNLTVITSVDKKIATAAVTRLKWRNSLITLAGLSLSIAFIYLFAKSLTEPIKRLMGASQEVSRGQYDIQLKATSSDEIGVLTDSFLTMTQGLKEREKMKEAFGKFVNEQIAEMAMKGEIKLGGERKQVAIFFSDIRSFTAISESMQPEQVVEFLNEYMTAMVDCVNKTNGVVDKYIGDAIMAVWGTPVSHGNDTENAINGALMMREALRKFNQGRGSKEKPIIKIGCGINTGAVLAGQIGSSQRMEYTVIGDAVNLASRVEALNKPFGTDILITSDAYKLVKDTFLVEPMQKIKVKGKKDPQQIFAVITRKDNPLYKNLQDVRDTLGIAYVDASQVDPDKEEVKYEISK